MCNGFGIVCVCMQVLMSCSDFVAALDLIFEARALIASELAGVTGPNPKHQTANTKPSTLNSKPETSNSKP